MKIIPFILLFQLIFTGGFAQNPEIGVKAGLNFSNLISDIRGVAGYNGIIPGAHTGVYASFALHRATYFQPEIAFSLQGAKYIFGEHSIRYKLSYINLPLLIKVKVKDKFNIHAGPYTGLLLNTGVELNTDFPVREEDFEDLFESVDFGISGGIEYETNDRIKLGARLNIGLFDIRDNEAIDFSLFTDENDFKVHNLVLQAFAAYRIK